MKIKLALLENDTYYLKRFTSALELRYPNQFDLYSFTNVDSAIETIKSIRINIFLASEDFRIDPSQIPSRCSFAFFTNDKETETVDNVPTICKYQRVDILYKCILSLYSEGVDSSSSIKFGDNNTSIIGFTSASGGCGSSTLAAACAIHFTSKGYKSLYLNLEDFSTSDLFFSSEGPFCMSDVIFALKSSSIRDGEKKAGNFSLKLESCVKTDKSGVYYFSEPNVALDMAELSVSEIKTLIEEIINLGVYNYIILDINFSLNEKTLEVLDKCHKVVMVSDASKIANKKTVNAVKALEILGESSKSSISDKVVIAYNKFNQSTGLMINGIENRAIGGVTRNSNPNDPGKMAAEISGMNIFDEILQ